MIRQQDSAAPPSSVLHLAERLVQFEGPPESFLGELLRSQCQIGGCDAGAVLRLGKKRPQLLCAYPEIGSPEDPPRWLAQAAGTAEQVREAGQSVVLPLSSAVREPGVERAARWVVVVPMRGAGEVKACGAFVVSGWNQRQVEQALERLELTIGWLSLYEMRLSLHRRQSDLQRLRACFEVQAAVNAQERFAAAAMACCNEVATRWAADRVCLGMVEHDRALLTAISHVENFSRRLPEVGRIEAVMEECLDQDAELLVPAPPSSDVSVRITSVWAAERKQAVASMPIRLKGRVVAVLTLEREASRPFGSDEIEVLRLSCDLLAARLHELRQNDRWLGAKLAAQTRRSLAWAVGPRHTWVKAGVLVGAMLIVLACVIPGPDRVAAPFRVEEVQRRVVAAPFDGYIANSLVEPGERVVKGQVLASLHVEDLKLRLARTRAEEVASVKEAEKALRDGKVADEKIARARAAQSRAEADLLAYQIEQGTLRAPMDGVILTGELRKRLDAPVRTGEVLLELAPLDQLVAEVRVGEDRIGDLRVGQEGLIAVTAHPGRYVPVRVAWIHPVAEVIDQRNVFRVKTAVGPTTDDGSAAVVRAGSPSSAPSTSFPSSAAAGTPAAGSAGEELWLRPGMEGVAKIEVGRKPYAWLWTRDMVRWVRMKLWW